MNIKLSNVRFSYLSVYTPREQESDDGAPQLKYQATNIFEPGGANEKLVRDAMLTVAKEKWGDRAETTLKVLEASGRLCLKEGNKQLDKKTGEISQGYEDMLFVRSSAAGQDKEGNPLPPPLVMNKFGQKITAETKGLFTGEQRGPVSGDYGSVMLDIWAYDNPDPKKGKRIIATLKGIMVTRFGEPFGRSEMSEDAIAAQFAEDVQPAPELGAMMGE